MKYAEKVARRVLRCLMYATGREFLSDFDEAKCTVFKFVEPCTMTSKERVYSLRKSVEYVVKQNIPGDMVECGARKGGSMHGSCPDTCSIESRPDTAPVRYL